MGEIGPVPPGITDTRNERTVLPWLNDLVRVLERAATTDKIGRVFKGAAVADATETTASNTAQINALLASLRAAGVIEE